MNRDRLSLRQLLVTAFTGGLAPAAAAAGRSWQGALLALPVLLLAGWGLSALAPRWARLEGKPAGKALHILYMVWGAALLSRGLARCAGRVARVGGSGESERVWLVLLLAALLIWAVSGKPAAFFRGAEIFYLGMAAAAAALLVWGAFRVKPEYLAVPTESMWSGFLSAMETGGTFLFALPYMNRTAADPEGARRTAGWLGALALTAALAGLVTAGVLSPAVAAESEEPFFLMTATLGRSARIEGLASALWLLADVTYLGLLAECWNLRETGRSFGPPICVCIGVVLIFLGAPEGLPAVFWGAGASAVVAATVLVLLAAGENSG